MKFAFLRSKHLLVVLIATFAIVSCKKGDDPEETKSKEGTLSYFVKANASIAKNNKVTVKTGDSALKTMPVNWIYATVWVEKITFSAKQKSTTIMIEKNLNVFNGDALAGVMKLPEGSYKDVEVTMYCRKSPKSELAFEFLGDFASTVGGTANIIVASSYPFEAKLSVNEITINSSDNYKVTLNFNLNNVLTGLTAGHIESLPGYYRDGKLRYSIWKGGSNDEPFYDQIIQNWQNVATMEISKEENLD